jgi:hypothetical protein
MTAVGFLFAAEGQHHNHPTTNHSDTMNPEYENLFEDAPAYLCDGERSLLALREIYLEAGLSEEHASKSAAADYEDLCGCFAPCAA